MLPITEIHLPGLTASAAPAPAAPAPDTTTPIARRCRWNLTISGKAEYYDAAGTTSIPQSLGEAIVLLYIAAHPPEHFWTSRSPEHEDGMDTVLPFGMDPVSLRRDIAAWAARTFRHDEDAEILALAALIWVDGHATYAVPIDASAQKKTEPLPTGLKPTSNSSPEETPGNDTTPSTDSPSGMPTPPCTPASMPPESIA